MLLISLIFFAAFLFLLSGGLLLFYREAMLHRLAEATSRDGGSVTWKDRILNWRSEQLQSLAYPFQRILPRSPQDVSIVEKRLLRAGIRQQGAVNLFYAAKVVVPLFLSLLAFVTGLYRIGPIAVFVLTLGLGFMVPDFWLTNRMASRQLAIKLGLPDVLDLLVICIEAGLGLDQALSRVCNEAAKAQPEITDEFSLVILEQRAGHTRADAWRNLAERTGVEAFRALATIIIQAEQFGTGISRTLRTHSDTMRTKRRQQAEEEAAKTTVKMVFPLVFFVFPSVFVVTVGPSAILMYEAFRKYLQ
jgi:tight adherence protein C